MIVSHVLDQEGVYIFVALDIIHRLQHNTCQVVTYQTHVFMSEAGKTYWEITPVPQCYRHSYNLFNIATEAVVRVAGLIRMHRGTGYIQSCGTTSG